ncbi:MULTISPECIES: hypothetical protein [Enterobacteriaceae]|uniref:hypothetical protein n=1 Tax=Enterobacteriaceae TaxID=543 RepID=UPI000663C362|nr:MULTISPECIES: hypothetical protein [Enterobacteriaceae]EHD3419958.1 hypothetical protein [Escherichia coli O167]CAD7363232.1 Uncharacterised protein [Escherichia coli]CSQ21588.1 Uncharacterised protein [Shigella sonnei]HBD0239869.1 hypothetical protein [Escherichia coli]
MNHHEAHLPVVLNVPSDYTGRVLVYLDKGKVKSQCRLKSNEIVGSPEFFSELCIRAEIKPELLTGK